MIARGTLSFDPCFSNLTFPPERTSALVLREADEGAGGAVLAGAVPARVGGDGDLAEGGGVADGTGALEKKVKICKYTVRFS